MGISKESHIGFIGTGVMGKSMAGHLQRAGYPLHVYTRTKSRAQALVDNGAVWHDSVADLASACDVVITIVGFPADVEEVYLGDAGIIANVKAGSSIIDMTTSRPDLAVQIYQAAKERGVASLDAPVSGGDRGAREAILTIMVGGDQDAYHDALPLFQCMGKNMVLQGPAGSGQHTKMANQIAIAAGMLGVCEAVAYARRSGLDPTRVLESIGGGAAGSWSLSNYGPRIISGDFDPGFYVKHFIKDMTIALESSKQLGLEMPGLALAREMYQKLAESGGEDFGTHALYKLYDQ